MMTTEELAEAQRLKAEWAAEVLSRLLPTLVQRGVISQSSLDSARDALTARQQNAPAATRAMFDDLIDRLRRDFGGGHYG